MPRDQWELNFHVRFNASYDGVVFYSLDSGSLFQTLILLHFAAAAKSLQLCPTLCDPIDGSPPGSPVPRILQARTLAWVAISFSSAWKWKVKVKSLSRVRLFTTPWTAAHQSSPSMGFSRQEYWSGEVYKKTVTYIHVHMLCVDMFSISLG